MKRYFVCYYRLSTDKKKNKKKGQTGLGLDAQKKYNHGFVESVEGEIIGEFTDIESGSKTNRKELQKAILLCVQKNAALVVGKLDRLSRDGFRILVQLEDAGVEYIDSTSPNDNDFIKAVKFSLARDERQKVSQRTKDALQALKDKGAKLVNPQHLTDQARQKGGAAMKFKALANANNRRASAYATLLRESGMSFRKISDELNAKGFLTSQGKAFQAMSTKRVIEMISKQPLLASK